MSRPPFWILILMICLPALPRLIEHPWNIAPMGALALFAGAHIRDRRWAIAIPIGSAFLGDLALGILRHDVSRYTFHALVPFVYGCFLVSACLGMAVRRTWRGIDSHAIAGEGDGSRVLRRTLIKAVPVAGATLAGSIVFFIVTNYAVWQCFPTYAPTTAGLLECYALALPFFRNTLESDAFFVTVLFGGYALVQWFMEHVARPELGADEARW